MKNPIEGTAADKICKLLQMHGPITVVSLAKSVGTSRTNVHRIADEYGLKTDDPGTLRITGDIKRLYAKKAGEKVEKIGIVPPRHVSHFTPPMTGYAARMLRAARTRDDVEPICDRVHFSAYETVTPDSEVAL